MKAIVKTRHPDGSKFTPEGIYNYYDIESKTKKTLTKAELEEYSKWLPHKCKEICLKVKYTKCSMTAEEASYLMLLCSLSIYCWGGYPKTTLIGISAADYATDFYIQMVHQLSIETKSGWSPERSRWANYVKFVRMKTMPVTIRRWETTKSGAEVNAYNSAEDSFEQKLDSDDESVSYDFDSVATGCTADCGAKVNNVNTSR